MIGCSIIQSLSRNCAWCRLHQSSAVHAAASPIATALPFSPSQLNPTQADTPRFATLGSSNQQKSMLGEASSQNSARLHRDSSPSPAHARVSSSYSHFLPGSPQRFPPNSMGSSFQSPADAHPKAQNGLYSHSRSRDSEYTQNAFPRSPVHRATPSSPYLRAVPGSSPLRSPAHAAAVSAVEQQLHASLHEEQGLLRSAQGRAAPASPSALPAYYPSKEHTQDRLSSAGSYQPWQGHLDSRQYSGPQLLNVADSLSQPSRLSQVPHDSHSLSHSLGPFSQHASPELDSLSQRLRDQKLARGASLSPRTDHTGTGAGPHSTGLASTYMHRARPDPSPSRCDHLEQCSPLLLGMAKDVVCNIAFWVKKALCSKNNQSQQKWNNQNGC